MRADPACDTACGTLCGRRVILVHGDAFFGGYLGDVIAASGATIVGVVALAGEGAAMLDHDPPPCALVLDVGVPGHDAVARVAAARGVALLLVQPAGFSHDAPSQTAVRQPALTMPFAGFQVVDALRRLLYPRATDPVAPHAAPPSGR